MNNIDSVTSLCFGEMLFDMLPSGKKPGGAPMNVAVHLKNLGVQSAIISRVGDDDLGLELTDFVESKKVINDLIQVGKGEVTGTVRVNLDKNDDPTYTVEEGVAWDAIDTSFLDQKELNPEYIIHGSLACRSEKSKRSLLELLRLSKAINVFDLNLRSPFYNKALLEDLLNQTDILKINDDEYNLLKRWYEIDSSSEKKGIETLQKNFKNIGTIILTKGACGSILWNMGDFFISKGIPIEVEDTIGSGDSFLAGFLSSKIQGANMQDALDFATSTGAYVATKSGANPRYLRKDIYQLMKSKDNELKG